MRHETTHERFLELSAQAAVGGLDGVDRARFDAHLADGCVECASSLRDLSAVAAALPWALPDARLDPAIRERLMARVATGRGDRPVSAPSARPTPVLSGLGRQGRLWRWAGGLVAAGVVAALGWDLQDARQALQSEQAQVARLAQELAQERAITSVVAHTDTHTMTLKGLDAAGRAAGWIVWSPSRREGFVVVHNLPVLGAGQEYRLWSILGQDWLPAGAFQVDPIGHAALKVRVEREHPELFAVTVEPAGARSAPTGPTVMTGVPAG